MLSSGLGAAAVQELSPFVATQSEYCLINATSELYDHGKDQSHRAGAALADGAGSLLPVHHTQPLPHHQPHMLCQGRPAATPNRDQAPATPRHKPPHVSSLAKQTALTCIAPRPTCSSLAQRPARVCALCTSTFTRSARAATSAAARPQPHLLQVVLHRSQRGARGALLAQHHLPHLGVAGLHRLPVLVRVPYEVRVRLGLPRLGLGAARPAAAAHVLVKVLKVLRVQLVLHLGRVGRPLRVQRVPGDAREEGVRLDFVHALRAQPLLHVAHEALDEVLRGGRHRHLVGEAQVRAPVDDLAARGERVVAVEGRVAHHHLKHDGAQRPPVALHAVPLLEQHLGRDVVGRAHRGERQLPPVLVPVSQLLLLAALAGGRHSPCAARVLLALGQRGQRGHVHRLAQPKVAQLHVAVRGQQQVVGLDVPVDVAAHVDVGDGEHRLRDVEARLSLAQDVLAHQQRHHVAPRQVLHDQVQVLLVLERVEQLDHVGRVHLGQHVALRAHVLHLAAPQHLRLFQLLHGHDLGGRLLAHDAHLPERAAPDDGQRLKVVRRDARALQAREVALALLQLRQHGGGLSRR
mmetsp:Transcript_13645/g.33562  ORF Transcript_13645/g.33562 Transcript_13645/m.33562 type:complete len:577 (-) Transcript_13645:349-2079(-)